MSFSKVFFNDPFPLTHRFTFTLQGVLTAVSKIKDSEGYTPSDLLDFLINLLKYNDNSSNSVCFFHLFTTKEILLIIEMNNDAQKSDNRYLSSIFLALSNTNTIHGATVIEKQIDKFLKGYVGLDEKQKEEYSETVDSCLHCLADLQLDKKLDFNFDIFEYYFRCSTNPLIQFRCLKSILLISCASNRKSHLISTILELMSDPRQSSYLKVKVCIPLHSPLPFSLSSSPNIHSYIYFVAFHPCSFFSPSLPFPPFSLPLLLMFSNLPLPLRFLSANYF